MQYDRNKKYAVVISPKMKDNGQISSRSMDMSVARIFDFKRSYGCFQLKTDGGVWQEGPNHNQNKI